jgi:hypothetical protein
VRWKGQAKRYCWAGAAETSHETERTGCRRGPLEREVVAVGEFRVVDDGSVGNRALEPCGEIGHGQVSHGKVAKVAKIEVGRAIRAVSIFGHLWTTSGDGHHVHRKLLPLVVDLELKAVCEELLQHNALLFLAGYASDVWDAFDVIKIGRQPRWCAYDLSGVQVVSEGDRVIYAEVRKAEMGFTKFDSPTLMARLARLDGDYLKRRIGVGMTLQAVLLLYRVLYCATEGQSCEAVLQPRNDSMQPRSKISAEPSDAPF